jgi:hypothetical protein
MSDNAQPHALANDRRARSPPEHAGPNVAPRGGNLTQLVEEANRLEVRLNLARDLQATRSDREREREQPADQIIGRILERRAFPVRDAAEVEAYSPPGLRDGQ